MNRKKNADNTLFKIGLRIRQARKERSLTLADVARRTGLSKGLLSKIENFRALPSLPVLACVAQSLNIGMEMLVKGIGRPAAARRQLVRAGQRLPVKLEKSKGFNYAALISRTIGDIGFEAFVLVLKPGARRKPAVTDGDEFIFMLKGEIIFQFGNEPFRLAAGDAFYFDGRVPHAPLNQAKTAAELLVIYMLQQNNPKGNYETQPGHVERSRRLAQGKHSYPYRPFRRQMHPRGTGA
ncbi:MAG: XRE family transcriptional regulator [Kiritimatiellae bacterium]|jgi:transcriptional regulator with XRE-family HTH domain|nr:XRE family transcriptional regulator [Kiritimatiellia bacterium]